MANLITFSRLLLTMLVVALVYRLPPDWQLLNVLILIVIFVTDGIDGYVARKLGESSKFGAMFDIACDRIVELTMWIVFVDIDLVPLWVPLVFIIRGVVVDAIRSTQAIEHRVSPFSMLQTRLGQLLVAGKFMLIFYAVLKAVTFCWLMLIHALPALLPELWQQVSAAFMALAQIFVFLSVLICLLRGAPVVIEFVRTERATLLGRLGRGAKLRLGQAD
jgi:CDP-diacylglycerol--glycerol-3-phosphate 3-phosphatidyltransferase